MKVLIVFDHRAKMRTFYPGHDFLRPNVLLLYFLHPDALYMSTKMWLPNQNANVLSTVSDFCGRKFFWSFASGSFVDLHENFGHRSKMPTFYPGSFASGHFSAGHFETEHLFPFCLHPEALQLSTINVNLVNLTSKISMGLVTVSRPAETYFYIKVF